MKKGEYVSLTTSDGRKMSGAVRLVLKDYVILNDENFRPKVIQKSDIIDMEFKNASK